MVWARLIAGLLTAVIVGWIWERIGRPEWMRPRVPVADRRAVAAGGCSCRTILRRLHPGRRLPGARRRGRRDVQDARARRTSWRASARRCSCRSLLMAGLAFILALCSEADAFVAASFSTIPVIGKLVFLTVGPAVDVKLFAMQAGIFGRRFAVRFAPLTFVRRRGGRPPGRPGLLGVAVMSGRSDGRRGGGMNKETQSIVVALLGGLLISITAVRPVHLLRQARASRRCC